MGLSHRADRLKLCIFVYSDALALQRGSGTAAPVFWLAVIWKYLFLLCVTVQDFYTCLLWCITSLCTQKSIKMWFMTVSTNSVIYIYNFILPNKSNMFFLLLTHLPVHYFARPEGSAILITLYGYCMAYTNSLFFNYHKTFSPGFYHTG